MAFENWNYYIIITSDNTKVSAAKKGLTFDLSNIVDATFWSNVKSDGSDIRITQSDGTTEVARDVVSIDTTTETGQIRFDTSNISTTTNEDYYIYFGNASATEPTVSSTYGQYNAYDTNIVAYYALDETSGTTASDRTSNSNNGTASNSRIFTSNTGTSGLIDSGTDFTQGNDHLQTGVGASELDITNPHRVTLNFYKTSVPTSRERLINSYQAGFFAYDVRIGSTGRIEVFLFDGASSNLSDSVQITTNQWNRVTISQDSTNTYLYVNGTQVDSFTGTIGRTLVQDFFIATQASSTYFNGFIDEIFIENDFITADEESTLYENETNNSSFWTTAAVQDNGEKISIDTQSLSFTPQDINLSINRNISLDTQSLNFTSQDINLKITRRLSIDTTTLSFTPQDINVSSGETINIDSQTLSFTPQDINLSINRNLSLDTQSLNFTPQDINLKITRRLSIDTTTLSFTPQDVNLRALGNEINIDTQSLNFIPQNIKFRINFSQSKLQNLNQARKDVIQIINETGENLFYRKYTQTLDSVGQFSNLTYTDYLIKGIFIGGDNKVKSSNEFGEFVSGTQRLNVAYILETSNGEIIQPQVRDCVISFNKQIQWEITEISELRMFGDVIDNYLTLQRKDLIE